MISTRVFRVQMFTRRVKVNILIGNSTYWWLGGSTPKAGTVYRESIAQAVFTVFMV